MNSPFKLFFWSEPCLYILHTKKRYMIRSEAHTLTCININCTWINVSLIMSIYYFLNYTLVVVQVIMLCIAFNAYLKFLMWKNAMQQFKKEVYKPNIIACYENKRLSDIDGHLSKITFRWESHIYILSLFFKYNF